MNTSSPATQSPRSLWLIFTLIAAMGGCAATPTRAEGDPTQSVEASQTLMGAMQAELNRSMTKLRIDDYEAPYFIAYRVRDHESRGFSGRYGAIVEDQSDISRLAYVEVRVGDYQFDNYANVASENYRYSEYSAERTMPIEPDTNSIRGTLWLLSDEVYKNALSDYLSKRGGAVFETAEKMKTPSFSKEEPLQYWGEVASIELDEAKWTQAIRDVTKSLMDVPGILDVKMTVSANRTRSHFVDTEGTQIVEEQVIYSIQLQGWARADDGMMVDNARSFYARTPETLPDVATVKRQANQMITELSALTQAPVLDPYTGPAILMPEASGVLFHEAVGHRLEGERQRNPEEGRTFKGRVGRRIIPTFLSIYDDPTLTNWGDKDLNGYYEFDDEGVPSQRVQLVEDGVLRNFLKSRTPIEGSLQSNGHGRASGLQKPMARMGNLLVVASPEQTLPYKELKARLLDEVRKAGKPFGLVIRDISGGSTNTSGYGYQAFKGSTRMVYKVDPATGEETLVRGVEVVGTPLTSINKIVAASQETNVFNGYCGAESGYVPVSAIAPALLTTEIELQRTQQSEERPPILPAPWETARRKKAKAPIKTAPPTP
ncbi:TldD/PmbA family protein [Bradymonas sediminis]|uniref:TldD/PmbA family protein n=1 Tax=Bradymonas sediminis TaxID=1548548 RepID=A0A2Z4FLV0_9DELT|nr:TldD/PmbA family protein [Bradymonas sediminis]AWV89810.1 TldD/PmbA family protein [Bradymonas sediminis]TDP76443.1 putative Zn-dependent protease [Bradymonas sediminis]